MLFYSYTTQRSVEGWMLGQRDAGGRAPQSHQKAMMKQRDLPLGINLAQATRNYCPIVDQLSNRAWWHTAIAHQPQI
jgi:hypothetical protein